jgi:hypothetical protein
MPFFTFGRLPGHTFNVFLVSKYIFGHYGLF